MQRFTSFHALSLATTFHMAHVGLRRTIGIPKKKNPREGGFGLTPATIVRGESVNLQGEQGL